MKLALVLTGGGARGAYQVGVLRYLIEKFPDEFKPVIWCGTSAGAINTAFMSQFADDLHRGITNLEQIWTNIQVDDIYRINLKQFVQMGFRWFYDLFFGKVAYTPRYRSLFDTKPLYRKLSNSIDEDRIHAMINDGHLEAVTITCTEYGTGKAVIFVEGGPHNLQWSRHQRVSRQTKLSVNHVMASAALPLLFPAASVHGIYYGDGSMRDNHPLSPAAKLGADKIMAIGVRGRSPELKEPARRYPTMATIGGALFNSIFLDALDSDYEGLARINRLIGDDSKTYRKIETYFHHPTCDIGSASVKYFHELPRMMRHVFMGFGKNKDGSSADFLSYVLFSGAYAKVLIDQGYQDAADNHEDLKNFLSS